MYTELQYPIFLDASKYATDTFWKYIFEDLAYGRTPYGTYIVKNFLCCNYKGKEFSYKIDEDKNSKQLYDDLYKILHNKFGLLSMEDKQQLRTKFDQNHDAALLYNVTWANIKKKNIKRLIIENFVIEMKKKYNLSLSKTKELLRHIIIGIAFKTIQNDDIEYYDGKIHSINNFSFEKNNYKVNTNILDYDSNQVIQQGHKKKMIDNWDKYLTNFKKIRSFK